MKETRLDMSMPSHAGEKPEATHTQSVTGANSHDTADQTPHSDEARLAHSTGVADSGRWSTRRIAIYALFVALSMAVSFIEFPIMPGVPWLKYDPSGIVSLVAGFTFGPAAAAIVSVLGFAPHALSDPFGTIMAVAVALAMSVPASVIYRRMHTRRGAALGLLVGGVCALVVAILGNLIITPFYAHMTVAEVAAMIVPILLPFNILKFAIHAIVTFLVYKPVSDLLRS